MRNRYTSEARRQRINGLALMTLAGIGFAGLFGGAYAADKANGISVGQSLCANGLGCSSAERAAIRYRVTKAKAAEIQRTDGTAAALRFAMAASGEAERPAVPARLLGLCGGQILAAESESAFPAGCAWIEPIRADKAAR